MYYAQLQGQDIVISGQPVQVAVVFNTIGDMKPLQFCIEDLYGNILKTKIEYVRYKKDVRGGISYCCMYKCVDCLKEIVLTYYLESHLWVIT
ncbi:hypothetical protein [Anaerocolumna chitinilytica]|uniref:Uncharacterized protein n=1 Tax=Anaerocolumna chitinilytica TaxID=1727145 RepID=A0A7M3SA09_9FIRM|nr:hypothetical protein [Anaerocolumna chitinilytica]BCK01427.1 hypothetical protein bsdcttw_44670 [Anaerocolumna chitinilytica]